MIEISLTSLGDRTAILRYLKDVGLLVLVVILLVFEEGSL